MALLNVGQPPLRLCPHLKTYSYVEHVCTFCLYKIHQLLQTVPICFATFTCLGP